jgi:peptide/nickel transport system substrate-binding protein
MAAITTNFIQASNQSQFSFFQYQIPSGVGALAFNTRVYPTNITAIRSAIAHAINYTDIIDKVYYGRAKETVGPASPNYGPFYNPGNFSIYSYNVTEAKAYLISAGHANGQGLPQLSITVPAGMAALTLESQIIQADLAQIGLNVNIQTIQYSDFQNLYGNFGFNRNNSANIPELTFLGGGPAYLPDYLAPTDYWVNFVTSYSLFANYAIYSNPVVDSNVAFMSNTSDVNTIVSHLQIAQQQIYNDVPYAWLPAPQLWLGDGSFFWNNHVISQVWFDPGYGGINDCPLFNTVVLASS